MRRLLLGVLVAVTGMAFAVPVTAADGPPVHDPTYDPVLGRGVLSGHRPWPECEVYNEAVPGGTWLL